MTAHSPSPDIFWVLGTDTHVGKTTIAATVIEALNRGGWPAVGFKPFGGFLLQEAMEFGVEQLERSGCELCGSDAERLAKASPLTPPSMMDVVGPMYLLSYPVHAAGVLMRMGSRSLGNVRYLYQRSARILLERPDVLQLLKQLQVPLETMETTRIFFREAPTIYPAAQADAFARLLSLRPRAVVIEGASQFVPIWNSMMINHIFVVTGEAVVFYPDINLEPPFMDRLVPLPDIGHRLDASPRSIALPMTLARPANRDAVAAGIVNQLLTDAGLLGTP